VNIAIMHAILDYHHSRNHIKIDKHDIL